MLGSLRGHQKSNTRRLNGHYQSTIGAKLVWDDSDSGYISFANGLPFGSGGGNYYCMLVTGVYGIFQYVPNLRVTNKKYKIQHIEEWTPRNSHTVDVIYNSINNQTGGVYRSPMFTIFDGTAASYREYANTEPRRAQLSQINNMSDVNNSGTFQLWQNGTPSNSMQIKTNGYKLTRNNGTLVIEYDVYTQNFMNVGLRQICTGCSLYISDVAGGVGVVDVDYNSYMKVYEV